MELPEGVGKLVVVPEETELISEFIEFAINYNKTSKESHMEVLLTTDGYCTIIEFAIIDNSCEWECPHFELVGTEEKVVSDRESNDKPSPAKNFTWGEDNNEDDSLDGWRPHHDHEEYEVESVGADDQSSPIQNQQSNSHCSMCHDCWD